MLIDGDTSFLKLMSTELQKKDELIEIVSVSSISKAFNLLDNKDFDAIVSSCKTSEIEGVIELLKEVRKREMEIPFFIFSRKWEKEFVFKALKLGANRIIPKNEDEDKNDSILSCKILAETLKQEIQDYENKKELEHLKKEFNKNFRIVDI